MDNNNNNNNTYKFNHMELSCFTCKSCGHPIRYNGYCSNPECILNNADRVMQLDYDYEGNVQRGVRPREITEKIEECLEVITAEYGIWDDSLQKKWLDSYMFIRKHLDLPTVKDGNIYMK